ncbi:MAG: ECF transporter S component [Halanaerobiales bacterium]
MADLEPQKIKEEFWTPKRAARIAILIALSGVGALIKIPSPTGTVALDSAPGYFVAIAFGPLEGMLVAGIGHIFTALTTGFPLSLPVHFYVAIQMAVYAYLFFMASKKINLITGIIIATALNGVLASALMIPIGGAGMFVSLLPSLTAGSLVNLLIAAAAYKIVSQSNLSGEDLNS